MSKAHRLSFDAYRECVDVRSNSVERVPFGSTGLETSRLGIGLAEIGSELSFEEIEQAGELLNEALDRGINFLDTAA